VTDADGVGLAGMRVYAYASVDDRVDLGNGGMISAQFSLR
jgi:hypothetical protein